MSGLMAPVGGSSTYEPAPEGMHVARCVRVIDLGTQEVKYNDHATQKRQVLVMFELPNETRTYTDKDGTEVTAPFMVTKKYTLSAHPKSSLRADLESWYGKRFNDHDLEAAGGFDLAKVLDRPALLNIVHDETGKYANIKTISPLMKGMACPARVGDLVFFALVYDLFDPVVYGGMSEKMQAKIASSPEYKALTGAATAAEEDDAPPPFDDSDIPF